jgi:hypothetical protein
MTALLVQSSVRARPHSTSRFSLGGGALSHGKTLNFSDGGMMTVKFADRNFLAANNENIDSSSDSQNRSEVKMLVDGWQFFDQHVIRQIVTINDLKWAGTPSGLMGAWDTPNTDDTIRTSTLDILDHMRAGKELVMQSWMMPHRIPLAGFGSVLDEFSQCTHMQQEAAQ